MNYQENILNTAREPQGIPTGGQFEASIHPEPEVAIGPAKPPFEETLRSRRGHDFLPPDVGTWPKLYQTEDSGLANKPFVARYFIGRAEWLVAEIDQETGEAFGYADLGQGHGEFGGFSLEELEGIQAGPLRQPIERDLDFVPGTLAKDCIEKYRENEAASAQ